MIIPSAFAKQTRNFTWRVGNLMEAWGLSRAGLFGALVIGLLTVFYALIAEALKYRGRVNLLSKDDIKQDAAKPRAWRITRIPANVSRDLLQEQLEKQGHPKTSETANNVLQLNIAPSILKWQCATVTFRNTPSAKTEEGYDIDQTFLGVTPLYNGEKSLVDIIAVPGLGSHPLGSFKSPTGWEVWLRDYLPIDIPDVRVLLYGYDTGLANSDSKSSIRDLAKSFLESIRAFRAETLTDHRPMIFVGHSLGGLLIKEALVLASEDHEDPQSAEFLLSSCGLMFFGVPNLGLRNDQLATIVAGQANAQFVRNLLVDKDSEPSHYLEELSRKFMHCCKAQATRFEIVSYYERKESATVELSNGQCFKTGPKSLLVTRDSASRIGIDYNFHKEIPLEADHSGLIKFTSQGDENYRKVQNRLRDLIKAAPGITSQRFSQSKPSKESMIIDVKRVLEDEGVETIYKGLRSLSFTEMNFRRLEVTTAARNTVKWLISHPLYLNWLKAQLTLLWVKGKPGAGKSTLMKFALLEAQKEQKTDAFILLTFFFNARGEKLQKTPAGLYRSILHQLLVQAPFLHRKFRDHVKDKEDRLTDQDGGLKWHLQELQDLLSLYVQITKEKTKIRILVDTSDECGEEAASDVVLFLESLIADKPANRNLVICFSCRHYPILEPTVGQIISVETENMGPIALHVRESLKVWRTEAISDFDDFDNFVDIIERWIVQHASGVFQWVCLVLGVIKKMKKNGKSLKVIQKALANLPKDLGDLYERILWSSMDDLGEEDRVKSVSLMQWVCFARTPLSLTELGTAMAFETEPAFPSVNAWKASDDYLESSQQLERMVTHLSGGLAGVFRHDRFSSHQGSANVEFIHETVNDFVKAKSLSILQQFFPTSATLTIGRCYDRLTRSCINYLRTEDLRQSSISKDREIRSYASDIFWYSSQAEAHSCSQSHLTTLLEVSSTEFVGCWRFIHPLGQFIYPFDQNYQYLKAAEHTTLLHMLVWYDIKSAIIEFLGRPNRGVDLFDSCGRTPLLYALRKRNSATVMLLLKNGAKLCFARTLRPMPFPQLWVGDPDFAQPVAALHKTYPQQPHCDALQLALQSCDIELAQYILSREADVHFRPQSHGSLLHVAANLGFPAIVKLLVDRGDDVNVQSGFFGDALQASSCRLHYTWNHLSAVREEDPTTGYVQTTKSLLPKETEVISEYECSQNRMSVGLDNVFYETAKRGWGSYINHPHGHHSGSDSRHAMVVLLLTKGANVNNQGGYFGNALQAASHAGDADVVRLLLNRGANVNAQGGKLGNALQAASSMGHCQIVKLLLDRGADVNAKGGHFGCALQAAAFRGSILLTLLLLDHGADIDAHGGKHGSPLQAALENDHRTREHKGVALLLWSTQQATENPLHRPYLPEKYYRAYYNRE